MRPTIRTVSEGRCVSAHFKSVGKLAHKLNKGVLLAAARQPPPKRSRRRPTCPSHTHLLSLPPATNPLGQIKQIIFVRHGQHASIMGNRTPCLSQHGMGRALMLAQYLSGKDGSPPGLKAPTLVYAMNG